MSPSIIPKTAIDSISDTNSLSITTMELPTEETVVIKKNLQQEGRTIIKNMEEVLNSVKKKYKHKHKHHHRKKERNPKISNDQEIIDISNISDKDTNKMKQNDQIVDDLKSANIITTLKSPSKENIAALIKNNKKRRPYKKKSKLKLHKKEIPLNENINKNHCSNEISSQKNIKPNENNESLEISFDKNEISEKLVIDLIPDEIDNSHQQPIKKNAFEFMMNARNKIIGTNSPGKERISLGNSNNNDSNIQLKTNRKLFLEEWADRKGAKKRKLNEVDREEYLEHKLKEREKRLKSMIDTSFLFSSTKKSNSIASKKLIESKVKNVKTIVKDDLTDKPKAKISKRTSRRISSIEINCDDTEFIGKLSSPSKKRDSLLGYFPTVSPNTEPVDDIEPVIPTTPNGRPRRSCTVNARYDYDLEKNKPMQKNDLRDVKKSSKSNSKDLVKGKSEQNTTSLDISIENIICDETTKLAPVFAKLLPKPLLDPKILEARNAFLMSGVPDKVKLEQAKRKQFVETFEESTEIFPKISHVTQCEIVKMSSIDWNKCGIIWKEEIKEQRQFHQEIKSSSKLIKIIDCSIKNLKQLNVKLLPPLTILPQINNKRVLVKNWKSLFEQFPTYKCYNQLREKYRYFSAMDAALNTKQVAESFVVTTKSQRRNLPQLNKNEDNDEKPPESAPNGEELFTDKYKPMSSQQVLVNLTPLNELKEFLLLWQDDGRNTARLNNSMDDFDLGNDSSVSFSSTMTTNTVVLLGPNSSGKTQSVFALADELNFNVLEINAGMKRTGKKLLQELQEATQSHRIRKDVKENLLKKSLNGNKIKKKSVKNDVSADSSSSSDLSNETTKMSLILVEDADLIFDQHDMGFVDAIYQLASISKRPVIVIANNPNCQHLMRLINQNSIEFRPPNAKNISRFLSILSLVENCPIQFGDINKLYMYNNMDLRKTILEMQFFIQSGGDRRELKIDQNQKDVTQFNDFYIHSTLFQLYTNAQNNEIIIPYPVDMKLLRTNLSKIFEMCTNRNNCSKSINIPRKKSPKKILNVDEENVFDNLIEFYENISIASCSSTREIDNRLPFNMQEEVNHYLIENSIKNILKKDKFSYNLIDESSIEGVIIIPNITNSSYLLASKSKFLDYQPILRSICRSEKLRSSVDRRSTRFYHYLRNIYENIPSFSTELFDNSCSILMDNINKV